MHRLWIPSDAQGLRAHTGVARQTAGGGGEVTGVSGSSLPGLRSEGKRLAGGGGGSQGGGPWARVQSSWSKAAEAREEHGRPRRAP